MRLQCISVCWKGTVNHCINLIPQVLLWRTINHSKKDIAQHVTKNTENVISAATHKIHLLYSALIWQSIILVIGDLRSKSQLLKPPIINMHAHSNARVHQIAKLKTANYILLENYKIKFCQYKVLYSIVYSMPGRTNNFHEFFDIHVHMHTTTIYITVQCMLT